MTEYKRQKTAVAVAVLSMCALCAFMRLSRAEPQTIRYTYDAADRLTRALYDKDGVIVYQYDESGNRTRKTVIGPNNPNADYDGNTVADLWEYIYFGFTGINPDANSDGDLFTDGEEAQCWTDPTNSLSYLQMSGTEATFDASNMWVVIKWPSEQYATYAIDKATNLLGTAPFTPWTNGIASTPPLNTYTARVDDVAPVFFRIKVEGL